MAETPEEVAGVEREAVLLLGTGCIHEPDPITKAECHKCLASALRAQYVAGLERASEGACFTCRARIRSLAEQAKREGT